MVVSAFAANKKLFHKIRINLELKNECSRSDIILLIMIMIMTDECKLVNYLDILHMQHTDMKKYEPRA